MRNFRIKTDIERVSMGSFQLPLGVDWIEALPPTEGYTLDFTSGEDGEPDTYAFQVVVSHERVQNALHALFELLPSEVIPVAEVGSVDAYRSVDVYVGSENVFIDDFKKSWDTFEPILLEDVSIGAGVTSEEPFLEIFLDVWKTITIHCPVETRETVEKILNKCGIHEVPLTWPEQSYDEFNPPYRTREVLLIEDEHSPDLDELLLQIRSEWGLQLNIDPASNLDDGGRELGYTLWHAIAMAGPLKSENEGGAYITVWVTAANFEQAETLIESAVETSGEWIMSGMYSIERVAFDERPDELLELAPRRSEPELHLVVVDEWGGKAAPDRPGLSTEPFSDDETNDSDTDD